MAFSRREGMKTCVRLALAALLAIVFTDAEPAHVSVVEGGDWVSAVLSAPVQSTVLFGPGTYSGCPSEGLAIPTNVSLVGSRGAASTTIDCQGAGRHFRIGSDGIATSVLVRGLTLTGGVAPGDTGAGGCILANGSSASVLVTVEDSSLSECSAALGGAIAVIGSAAANIHNSTLQQNTADEDGGGIYVTTNSVVTVIRSKLIGNVAGGTGGAMHVDTNSLVNMSEGVRVLQNQAGSHGGGVSAEDSTVELLQDVEFRENKAKGTTADGGALDLQSSILRAAGNIIMSGNYAGDDGGALKVYKSQVTFVDNIVMHDNHCEDNGGAIYAYSSSAVHIRRGASFTDNMAEDNGGAIYLTSGTNCELTDSVEFIGNVAGNVRIPTPFHPGFTVRLGSSEQIHQTTPCFEDSRVGKTQFA